MRSYHVTRSRRIAAPAAQAYALIADYRTGHPRIVPPAYFSDMIVEQGGVGAGTTIQFTMRVLGTTRRFRAHVTEPQPGHTLVERNEEGGSVTTFIVEPLPGGRESNVTITTEFAQRPGFVGAMEQLVTSMMLQRIFRLELERIEQFATSFDAAAEPATRAA